MAKEIVLDLSKKNTKLHESIDFLDVQRERRSYSNTIGKLDAEALKKFCFGLKNKAEMEPEFQMWKRAAEKITSCYYEAVSDELSALIARSYNNEADVLLTKGAVNKTRQHVRTVANMLLKNRPMFEPDPSGSQEALSEQDLIIATRFLEHTFDKGGLRKKLPSIVKEGLRTNRGIIKVSWSAEKKDIDFNEVNPLRFYFDFQGQPEDSCWFCEQREIRYYDLHLSGLFTESQLESIRIEMGENDINEDNLADIMNRDLEVYDYYFKIRDSEDKDKFKYLLITFLEDHILIRKTEISEEDFPFHFFIPEREADTVNGYHSMNDVANASVTASYINFKVLNMVENLSETTLVVDEKTKVDRTTTPGVRTIRVNSTDGVTSMAPMVPSAPTIPQDVFFHLDRLERIADANLGIHPDILTGLNGNVPGNGLLSQTMLANDIQNTSMVSQEFGEFLASIAYNVLHIAYHMYQQHRSIVIEPTGDERDEMKVVGGSAVNEENQELFGAAGVKQIKKFPQIKVKVIPGSAYTDAAKQQNMMALMQADPSIVPHIPIEEKIASFATGGANLMIHKAARQAKRKQEEEENHDVAIARAENKAMMAGIGRIPQPNDDHRIHDEIHLIEEMMAEEQMRKASTPQEQQQWTGIVNLIRSHRQQHQQSMQAQASQESQTTIPSSPAQAIPDDETGRAGHLDVADDILQ